MQGAVLPQPGKGGPLPLLSALASVFLLAGCAHLAAGGPGPERTRALALEYVVSYRPDHSALEVEIALRGSPRDFLFTVPGFVSTVSATVGTAERSLEVEPSGRVALPPGTVRLRYRYPLDPKREHLYAGAGEQGALVVAGRTWLLRPRVAGGVTATLTVSPADALFPWLPGADGRYHLTGEQLVDSGFESFGGRRCLEEVDGAQLEIAILPGALQVSDHFLCGWIRRSAQETLTVRRRFPYRRITVHLIPGTSSAPSPLGLTLWSSPPSLALIVGDHAEEADFRRDWVAVHELLHLLHPSFLHKAQWITEGLATYYTEVVRMRSGRQSQIEGWTALADGFETGRREGGTWTLGETEQALSRGIYRPVYWAGALIMLELDLAIRRSTAGARSLDDVLEVLGRRGQTATVADFRRAVDETAGRAVFDAVVSPHQRGPAFADLDAVLGRVGVRRTGNGVELAPPAPGEDSIREAIGRRRGTDND